VAETYYRNKYYSQFSCVDSSSFFYFVTQKDVKPKKICMLRAGPKTHYIQRSIFMVDHTQHQDSRQNSVFTYHKFAMCHTGMVTNRELKYKYCIILNGILFILELMMIISPRKGSRAGTTPQSSTALQQRHSLSSEEYELL
jgi:hypothetical protein